MAERGYVRRGGWGGWGILNDERRFLDNGGVLLPTNTTEDEDHRKDALYKELWHACAGPLVSVPRVEEKVFYFPQGHMEQVAAYTSQDGMGEMPIYNVPPRILCKVLHVDLKAEIYTDEVFAQITLLPEAQQDWEQLSAGYGAALPPPPKTKAKSFSKTLTPSDTSTHGGFSVPKRQADECLPPLDMSQQPPIQELMARDLHGFEWRFRHIFRGQPRRHLLTSGWSSFVTSKRLVAGDTCIFIRGENGEIRAGVHRATKLQNNSSATVISGHSMQHGILATAYHAISTGTMFTVYYRPWTSPSEFIIPYQKYVKCMEKDYSVGTRFRMAFEGEECAEQSYAGTVIAIGDLDEIRWPGSEWRCLKVQWDAGSDKTARPERVSPWSIEPMDLTSKKHASLLPGLKRPRLLDPSSFTFSHVFKGGVLQGQEWRRHLSPPQNFKWSHMRMGLERQLEAPIHSPFHHRSNTTVSSSSGMPQSSGLATGWPPMFTSYLTARNVDSIGSEYIKKWKDPTVNDDREAPVANTNCGDKFRLFGVNIFNPVEPPSNQFDASSELMHNGCAVPLLTSQSSISESIQVSGPSKSVSGIPRRKRCKDCCCITTRTCTKVLKYGTALGRSVDLSRFDGYDALIADIDQMFEFKGKLINGSSGWHVTYMDDEGDMMLIGSCPWQEFKLVVRRMIIYPKEEDERLNKQIT